MSPMLDIPPPRSQVPHMLYKGIRLDKLEAPSVSNIHEVTNWSSGFAFTAGCWPVIDVLGFKEVKPEPMVALAIKTFD